MDINDLSEKDIERLMIADGVTPAAIKYIKWATEIKRNLIIEYGDIMDKFSAENSDVEYDPKSMVDAMAEENGESMKTMYKWARTFVMSLLLDNAIINKIGFYNMTEKHYERIVENWNNDTVSGIHEEIPDNMDIEKQKTLSYVSINAMVLSLKGRSAAAIAYIVNFFGDSIKEVEQEEKEKKAASNTDGNSDNKNDDDSKYGLDSLDSMNMTMH